MPALYIAGGVVSLALLVYLFFALLTPEEERTWQRTFDSLFKAR